MSEQEKHDQRQQAMRARLDAVRPSRKGSKALAECLDIQEFLGVHYLEAMRISERWDGEREARRAARSTERAAAALAHTVEQWSTGDDIPF